MMKVNKKWEGFCSIGRSFGQRASRQVTLLTFILCMGLFGFVLLGCRESTEARAGDNGGAAPTPTPIGAPVSTLVIDDFLWKPISDSDGKLAVLVNPFGARIDVTGSISETLRPIGPGNGRGSTGRGSFPGCAFGNNVTVEVFDRTGARIRLKDGRDFITVPFGCSRFEFKL